MRIVGVLVLGIAVMGGSLIAQAPAAKIDAGKKVYTVKKCSDCHQIEGKGGKLSTALDGVATKKSAEEMKQWLTDPATLEKKLEKKPKEPMSKYLKTHKLTDADVDALMAYLLSLK